MVQGYSAQAEPREAGSEGAARSLRAAGLPISCLDGSVCRWWGWKGHFVACRCVLLLVYCTQCYGLRARRATDVVWPWAPFAGLQLFSKLVNFGLNVLVVRATGAKLFGVRAALRLLPRCSVQPSRV